MIVHRPVAFTNVSLGMERRGAGEQRGEKRWRKGGRRNQGAKGTGRQEETREGDRRAGE